MHELSYVLSFMELCRKELKKNETEDNSSSPKEIILTVGEMTGVLPEFLIKYFDEAKKDTEFKDTKLSVDFLPVKIKCGSCGDLYSPSKENLYSCPNCKGKTGEIIQGRELLLSKIIFYGKRRK